MKTGQCLERAGTRLAVAPCAPGKVAQQLEQVEASRCLIDRVSYGTGRAPSPYCFKAPMVRSPGTSLCLQASGASAGWAVYLADPKSTSAKAPAVRWTSLSP